MSKKAKLGEIWLVAIPVLYVKEENSYDTGFQIRPYLIVDEGKGMLIMENPDYLGLKITTKNNKVNRIEEIKNWKANANQPAQGSRSPRLPCAG